MLFEGFLVFTVLTGVSAIAFVFLLSGVTSAR